jgi:hypothetical protein
MASSSGHGSTLLKNFFDKNQNEPFLLMSQPTAQDRMKVPLREKAAFTATALNRVGSDTTQNSIAGTYLRKTQKSLNPEPPV